MVIICMSTANQPHKHFPASTNLDYKTYTTLITQQLIHKCRTYVGIHYILANFLRPNL